MITHLMMVAISIIIAIALIGFSIAVAQTSGAALMLVLATGLAAFIMTYRSFTDNVST